ncbi:hypothetical protein HDU79_006153 [Rhizoclosmatium sp. JEL0117]|nr:hypothetical protein HDU79_006153 [Rhizoclosmatium sp. JEL0117]
MEAETEEFTAAAVAFASSVDQLEVILAPLFTTPFDELVQQSEGMIDRASLCVLFSYLINSLTFLYLRTQGATKGHPVRKELARVKEYMDKVSEVAGANKAPMQLDQAAAKRFIKHNLSSNPEIKEKYSEKEREEQAGKFLESVLAGNNQKDTETPVKRARTEDEPKSKKKSKGADKKQESAKKSQKKQK